MDSAGSDVPASAAAPFPAFKPGFKRDSRVPVFEPLPQYLSEDVVGLIEENAVRIQRARNEDSPDNMDGVPEKAWDEAKSEFVPIPLDARMAWASYLKLRRKVELGAVSAMTPELRRRMASGAPFADKEPETERMENGKETNNRRS